MKTSTLLKIFENTRKYKMLFPGIILIFLLTSCIDYGYRTDYGYNGRPGNAYLSLTWNESEPDYIDAGTGDIPPVFEWGKYYQAFPGYYTLYYEGNYWDGWYYSRYAWEMDYTIRTYPGEPGGFGYNGADGLDTWFTIECTPFGPYLYSDAPSYKKEQTSTKKDISKIELNKTDSLVLIKNNYQITVTFKKVQPSHTSGVKKTENSPK
jgi:hypothetical protein